MISSKIVQPHYQTWKPVAPVVLKDKAWRDEVHEKGVVIKDLLSADQIQKLKAIYSKYHHLKAEKGGMFYSLYSSDYDYRLAVHNEIQAVLQPTLDAHLQDYKIVVNTFVVKASGPESEFYVHQDTTAVDEHKYTALSWWIPLQDMDTENGALAVVEKSHWFFSPLRGVSFPFAFSKIVDTVRDYLKPVTMKTGEVLIFDARVIHNSLPNHSGKDRVAIVCGVFPKDAAFVTCWKDAKSTDSPVELFKHDDDYTLKYPNFFYNCHDRPVSGEKIGEVPYTFPDTTADEFEALCRVNKIQKVNQLGPAPRVDCNMIAEPDGINKEHAIACEVEAKNASPSFFQKLFGKK